MDISIKRVYDPFSKKDGYHILVDRLWPRGLKKEEAHIDEWIKEIAPSNELRKWFDHDPEKWQEFIMKYHKELSGSAAPKELLSCMEEHKIITLLFAAKDDEHNNAVALKQFIEK